MFILVGVGASNVGYSQTTDSTIVVPKEEVVKDAPATGNEKVITGQVLSKADNSPVVGAIVFIKGTNIATETDENGNYSITVPQASANGTLVVKYEDDSTVELPLATTTNFTVLREEDVTKLETVQIIGYGTQEKEDVTGAISSVKSSEIAKVVVSDPAQAIQGRVTGVNVSQNTGAPGSPLNIQVRGVGTIGNSRPLFVVDDVPVGDISYLNQNDIESIDILKDASAAAVYGARAANGVVLITTKKGSAKKTTFEFNYLTGVSKAWKKIDMLTAEEWATLKNEALFAVGEGPRYKADTMKQGANMQDEIFRNAKMNSYHLAASGGTEKVTYYIGGGYLSQEGIVKGSNYERFSINTNANYRVTKKLNLGSFMNLATSSRRIVNDEGMYEGVMSNALKADPLSPVFSGRGGDSIYAPNITGDGRNPVAILNTRDNKDKTFHFIGRWFAEYEFIKGLKFKSTASFLSNNVTNRRFDPSFFVKNAAGQFNTDTNRVVGRTQTQNTQVTWENTLAYEKTFAEKHKIGLLGLIGLQNNRNEYFTARKTNVPTNGGADQYFDQASKNANIAGNASENALLSYMARINYEYDNKYLLTATLRRDASSRFPESNRWGTFPSIAAGWKISEEGFFEPLKKNINLLKLRASYGQLGNQNIGYTDYPYTTNLTTGQNYTFGDAVAYGTAPRSNANTAVTWETVTTSNVGVDVAAFKNKLLFSADFFTRKTADMLINRTVSGIAGYEDAPVVNAGTMFNKGLELMAEYRNQDSKLKYSVSGNITFIKNEVTYMDAPIFGENISNVDGAYVQITTQGRAISQFYGHQVDYIIQTEEEAAKLRASGYQSSARAGDFKFVDQNKDGKIDANDRTYIGSPLPKFTYGVNGSLGYANFDLSIFFQGVQGNKIYNGGKMNYGSSDFSQNYGKAAFMIDRWTAPNTSTEVPRVTNNDANQNGRISDYFVESGSYLRLKNIQLGYTLPASITDKVKIQKIRFYVAAQNLFTITKYSGLDPEIGQANYNNGNTSGQPSPLEIGVDRGGTYPQARTFQFGINAAF